MMVRVGAVGNRVLCGFPRSGGRVLCVHGSGCAEHVWQLGGESPLPRSGGTKG